SSLRRCRNPVITVGRICMSRRLFCAPDSPCTPHDDGGVPEAGYWARLTILSWPRLLAVTLFAVVLSAIEPASPTSGSPAWASHTGHPQGVQAVAFAPDGRRLATGGDDGAVVLWEVGRGVQKELLGEPSWAVYCLAFSPDGTTLAA